MTSSYYSGNNGRLYLGDKSLARVVNWNFSSTVNLLDTTALSDTDSSVIPGLRTTTGSCRIFFYRDTNVDGVVTNDCATLIKNLVVQKKGSNNNDNVADLAKEVKLKLFVDVGTTAGNYIEGNAYLSNVSMAMSVGQVLAADVQFQFTGALTGVTF